MKSNAPMKEQVNHPPTEASERPQRRQLFGWIWKLFALLACIEIGWITSSILTSRKRDAAVRKREKIIDAGMIEQFPPGRVVAVPQGGFYLSCLEDGSFIALSRTCTHLGCSVPWDENKQKFICPCHGSTFDNRGVVLTPPATRPLDYYKVKIENGLIRVDVSNPIKRDVFENNQAVVG
jgi:nitrite reductase/ring-hydroxylating ferredoxin subunit